MNRIQVLDCTLRDGGYCNQWKFGYKNIKKIIDGLIEVGVEIIECGFLTNKVKQGEISTRFSSVEEIANIIQDNREKKFFVAMINYGEYSASDLPLYSGHSIDGIRVAFHKKDWQEAIKLCEEIQDRGYKIFVQPMVTLSYTDEEYLQLISAVIKLKPYAFYIVDSFGSMKESELIHLFCLAEQHLCKEITIGFHSHNNLQLAYSNAQKLVSMETKRELIIDTTIYGMGRGAGNLNTELFVEYLNNKKNKTYNLAPLLDIIDEILNEFYQDNPWGYSLPNYLSAVYGTHPNYAEYLDEKKTLTIRDMREIFHMMENTKRLEFNKEYIEKLYFWYMAKERVYDKHKEELKNQLENRRVLLLAPGRSTIDEKEKIISCVKDNSLIVIAINGECGYLEADYIFLSNLRRHRELEKEKIQKCIVTSNINAPGCFLQIKYSDLINDEEAVKDNAGMMAIKFLHMLGVEEIYLAGFDGYSHDNKENYYDSQKVVYTKTNIIDAMNEGICRELKKYNQEITFHFLTKSKYL